MVSGMRRFNRWFRRRWNHCPVVACVSRARRPAAGMKTQRLTSGTSTPVVEEDPGRRMTEAVLPRYLARLRTWVQMTLAHPIAVKMNQPGGWGTSRIGGR